MTPWRIACVALCALGLFAAPPATAVEQSPGAGEVVRRPRLEIDVWVNRDEGGVYSSGESMRIFFRTNAEAYVLMYNIDTEGYIHLVYPYAPSDPPFVAGGRTVAVPARSDPYELVADGPPGVEYVVALASPVPFRNLPWFLGDGESGRDEERQAGDEEEQGYIVGDPYVGMARLNERIIPPGHANDVGTGETWFYIERRVEYPRYVCSDCHFNGPYYDPYYSTCSVVDVRIDAAWIPYAPAYVGVVRPRYYYVVRPTAPSRYRQWKGQWSSSDGRAQLRERFAVSHDVKGPRTPAVKERAKPREYFDVRRVKPGRMWQGRDQVLRLRERREEMRRERDQQSERAIEKRSTVDQLRERARERMREEKGRGDTGPAVTPGRRDQPRERVEQRQPPSKKEPPASREQAQPRRQEPPRKQEQPPQERKQKEKAKEDRPSPRARAH